MLKNYFLTLWRAAIRNPLVSTLNLLGLGISLAACMAIFLYVKSELSYDKSHPGFDRTFRLNQIIAGEGHIENSSSCPFPTLPALLADHADLIDGSARLFDFQIPVKSVKLEDGRLFNERHFYYTDSTIFDLLDIPLIRGDKHALATPFNIAITEELAYKYFGDEDAMGQVIFLAGNDKMKCTVTAIIGKGGASHITPEALISIETCKAIAPFVYQNWVWNPCWTYVRLKPGVDKSELIAAFPEFIQKHYPEFSKNQITHELQPIADIHLKSNMEFEMSQNSSMKYIYIFISTGIILLIIACINFVNLTSASILDRSREAGMRKVAGATKSDLMFQVLFESTVYTLFSLLLGVLILLVLNPLLLQFFGVQVQLEQLLSITPLAVIIIGIIAIAILSGLYPATLFSNLNVNEILKGTTASSSRGKWFRRTLVVAQFSVAVILIVFTVMAQRQLDFMRLRNKGFDPSNVLVMDIQTTPVAGQLKAFKAALKENANVLAVSVANDRLGVGNNNHEFWHDGMQEGEWKYFPALIVDEEFTETYGVDIIAGRDFDAALPNEDSTSVIVNEAMAKWLGYESPQDALGKTLHSMTGSEKIIGVSKDFHFKSLHHPVGPFVMDIADRRSMQYQFFSQHVAVHVANQSPETIAHIEKVWGEFVTNKPFDYTVLANDIARLYEGEHQMSNLLKLFSAIAMLVASMGLFALTWFVARSKKREIAVRKVFGAPIGNLILVATKEQLILITLSLVFAFPVAYLSLNRWLQSFAYRVDQEPITYLLAALFALVVAFLTMLYLALRTANQNPALVLKYE